MPSEAGKLHHSVADVYCDEVERCGQKTVVRDLYRLGFDPILKAEEMPAVGAEPGPDVQTELTHLSGCDVFTLIYPIWFGTPPAMLKGYIERIFGSGVTPQNVLLRNRLGFLTAKRLLIFTTSATKDLWLDEQGQVASLRQVFDRYLAHAFGMALEKHVHFGHILPGTRARWIDQNLYDVRQEPRRVCAEVLAATRHTAPAKTVGKVLA
ncbi:NAD(P)H-dependent oxidoreductase [Sphingomonas bacterium]|uniref:NAD(P)H-dependent oxidoreductase n=1 Tax=Sphingomonas bacterium TaxID=1895847 RepID=UPI0020C5D62F|nr:NAD(P)H-dependent oxidoreductase [Sphingomonas bacterium]